MTPEQAQKEAERRYPDKTDPYRHTSFPDPSLSRENERQAFTNGYTDGVEWAQEQAKIEAIRFHDWCDKNAWEIDHREEKTHTTKELYQIFKNTPQ